MVEPSGWFKVVAARARTAADNGLSEYLNQMMNPRSADVEVDERDYRTSPIRNLPEEEIIVDEGLRLMQKLPVIELKRRFSAEAEKLRKLRIGRKRPHTALIPSSRDLSAMTSFDELLAGKVFWLTE